MITTEELDDVITAASALCTLNISAEQITQITESNVLSILKGTYAVPIADIGSIFMLGLYYGLIIERSRNASKETPAHLSTQQT